MNLSSVLTRTGHRTTQARHAVFVALTDADRPISIAKLTIACPNINRSSIYRTLELFEHIGIITLINIGWKKRYELAEPFRPHHHHIICTECGKTIAIHPPELERLIETVSKQHAFTITTHHFELTGICKDCSNT